MTVTAYRSYTPAGRYGMRQLLRSETVKMATLRSTLWTLLITTAGMALVTIISANSALHRSADWYRGFDPTNQSLAGLLIGILTMGVFGAMAVTGEYASGTIRTSLSATPRRLPILVSKATVAGAGMLIVAEALSFACFALGQAILSGGGAPSAHLGQPGVARAVIMSGAFLALFGMLGMGLGTVIRNTAGAISAYVGVTFLLPLLLHPLSGDPVRYAPVQILANSVSVTIMNHSQVSPTVGLLLMFVYSAVVLFAGAVVFSSRDA
ncbi:MAG: ABC transporter permease subunit [Acidimicrobiales bacterium]|nr:ABC transporter permease subunit [Acidimicrobiales bacterium]